MKRAEKRNSHTNNGSGEAWKSSSKIVSVAKCNRLVILIIVVGRPEFLKPLHIHSFVGIENECRRNQNKNCCLRNSIASNNGRAPSLTQLGIIHSFYCLLRFRLHPLLKLVKSSSSAEFRLNSIVFRQISSGRNWSWRMSVVSLCSRHSDVIVC